ncbi:unnamed protein product, partial [Mesorhabditis belari]|uniref:Uncharacterized protein n=1 Tax=Mesorhabditis belari TaxID=2138241 RepID=A0AAF3J3A9_9BILA
MSAFKNPAMTCLRLATCSRLSTTVRAFIFVEVAIFGLSYVSFAALRRSKGNRRKVLTLTLFHGMDDLISQLHRCTSREQTQGVVKAVQDWIRKQQDPNERSNIQIDRYMKRPEKEIMNLGILMLEESRKWMGEPENELLKDPEIEKLRDELRDDFLKKD